MILEVLIQLLASVSVLAFALSWGLFADDGRWSATYSLSEGSLYSETENKDIAFHFRHTLSFKAGAKSKVDIRYTPDCVSGANNFITEGQLRPHMEPKSTAFSPKAMPAISTSRRACAIVPGALMTPQLRGR